jgi:hypothetical protein
MIAAAWVEAKPSGFSSAQGLLSAAGLCPPRICEDPGGHWYVEAYAGDTIGDACATPGLVREVATLLATVHGQPTAWFDELRDWMSMRYPVLAQVPAGNPAWWHVAKSVHFAEHVSEAELGRVAASGPFPLTAAGARLVTTHGDVHRGNLVRVNDELQLIDLEFAVVNFAIHDLCYACSTICDRPALRDEFARAYLLASGLPASDADVFALCLDIERCKMATVFFDDNAPWVYDETKRGHEIRGWETYLEYVEVADHSATDAALAADIVVSGFSRCARAMELHSLQGRPCVGLPVTVHDAVPDDGSRGRLLVNWDGTLQWCGVPWRGLVLGVTGEGEVILVHCSDRERALRLDLAESEVPITWIQPPCGEPTRLLLTGGANRNALVLGADSHKHLDNDVEFAALGDAANALTVHIEPDGVIRLANNPRQAFDVESGVIEEGRRVLIFHIHDGENQRFATNDDRTISPVGRRELVWGMRGRQLRLVGRDDADRLTFATTQRSPAAVPGRRTFGRGDRVVNDRGSVLCLESHPGKALAVRPGSGGEGYRKLRLAPRGEATAFVATADGLLCADGSGVVALGIPGFRP